MFRALKESVNLENRLINLTEEAVSGPVTAVLLI